ncbi:Chaperone protein DnaJ 11 [Quillaja saponaria]|uniref:Chaperone protein DnaJ 11 n=1 Tax=Quillaja saponaria TaxID=32244 RepID=A0AAD7KR25_QUISA|nr:Chaperone protein DnaJ 11 [Quillaja saponaria]
MLSLSPSVPSAASIFSGETCPSAVRYVRFKPTIAFATSTTSTRSRTLTEESISSYLSSHHMASCTSLYDILGIHSSASNQEIKAAYRRLARLCHPDVAAIDRKDSSADDFMKIHSSYSTLSDPEKRTDYDRRNLRRHRPLTNTPSRYSGYTRRKWETDQCW